jgi:Holliday junction resolvase RusA-like endonuclease
MIAFTILGEPASKANQRQIVTIGGRPSLIKSKKARGYEQDALRQIPPTARQRLEGPVRVTLRIWYASERPDLDESVILDVLQDRWKRGPGQPEGGVLVPGARVLLQAGIYRNDRQVREKHVFHGVDRVNPRCEILVEPLQPQQAVMESGVPGPRAGERGQPANDAESDPFGIIPPRPQKEFT